MRLKIDQANFLKALNRVQRVVDRRNTVLLISNVLLQAQDGRLQLKATDLDIEMQEHIPAQIDEPGALAAPAHLLYDIIRKLPQDRIIELSCRANKELVLQSGQAVFNLPYREASDFPHFSLEDPSHSFILGAKEVKQLIDSTLFAASTEETRYYLNGIYFHLSQINDQPYFNAVATDCHRLACCKMAASPEMKDMSPIIIPRKTMLEVQRLVAEDSEAQVTIDITPVKVRFRFNNITMTSKLMDGTFPEYDKVIPFDNDKMLIIKKDHFAQAVDLVATIAQDKNTGIKLHLDNDLVRLEVQNSMGGSAIEQVACNYKAEALTIGFNARYLLDSLGQLVGEDIKIAFAETQKPILMTEIDSQNTLYVVMPMRV